MKHISFEPKILPSKMDVERTFHMTGGLGTTSYAKNSSLQKKGADMVKHITMETVQELYLTLKPASFGIADLGCSSGPNTLSIIKDIIEAVEGIISPKIRQNPNTTAPEFRVYLNDLPTNDFNSIFRALPDFHKEFKEARRSCGCPCPTLYMAASPGSFYGRLFPSRCLHFVYSSYSLHWLSKVPSGIYDEEGNSINKGSVYISKSSPPGVAKAYLTQFQEDFSSFLRFRSEEVISSGSMVLILLGRKGPNHFDRGNYLFWEVLSRSISLLVSKGEVEKDKLDSYNAHFYAPSKEEIQHEIEREGSFELNCLEMLELGRNEVEGESYGTTLATTVRAIQEPMISHHFGESILDELFQNYAKLLDEEVVKGDIRPVTFVLVLKRL